MVELDHVFLFVANEQAARAQFEAVRLTPNYSRKHPGQGTTNLCACLDDMFIELLWLDGTRVHQSTRDVGLLDRGDGNDLLPLGIAWRGDADIATEPYHAPFLPEGRVVEVATISRASHQPFLFKSPSTKSPREQGGDRVGARQTPTYSSLAVCRLGVPKANELTQTLGAFEKLEVIKSAYRHIEFVINRSNGGTKSIVWPF